MPCPLAFLSSRPIALALLLLAAGAAATEAGPPHGGERPWHPVSLLGERMEYFIETASLRRQGDLTTYRLVGREAGTPTPRVTVDVDVGVHCVRRERVEYAATTRSAAGEQTVRGTELRPVAPTGREAREIEVACLLADWYARVPVPVAAARAPSERAALPPVIRSTGSAFAVGPDLLVTNWHVVHGCSRLAVMRGTERVQAQVLATQREHDLALVRAPGLRQAPLPLGDAAPELGADVVVLGYPLPGVLGQQLRVTAGIVSAQGGLASDRAVFQVSAAVQPGNSGGPVVDATGRVVGVVARKLDSRLGVENVAFAVDLPTLHGFLASQRVPAAVGEPGPALPVGEVVRRAGPAVLLLICG